MQRGQMQETLVISFAVAAVLIIALLLFSNALTR
jgi:hypothetical protein